MKTYEQMARDVLRRRDEMTESFSEPGKSAEFNYQTLKAPPLRSMLRGRVLKICAACGAAAAAVIIGSVCIAHRSELAEMLGNSSVEYASEPDASSASGEEYSVGWFCEQQPVNDGNNNIIFNGSPPEWFAPSVKFGEAYTEGGGDRKVNYTADQLSVFYGLEFDRLSRLHADWREFFEGGSVIFHDISPHDSESYFKYSYNSIKYTAPLFSGKSTIRVAAEKNKALPLPTGMSPEEAGYSAINGYYAMIYTEPTADDDVIYTAYIGMNSLVKISTNRTSEEDFLKILDEYTANTMSYQSTKRSFAVTKNLGGVLMTAEAEYDLSAPENGVTLTARVTNLSEQSFVTNAPVSVNRVALAAFIGMESGENDYTPEDKGLMASTETTLRIISPGETAEHTIKYLPGKESTASVGSYRVVCNVFGRSGDKHSISFYLQI